MRDIYTLLTSVQSIGPTLRIVYAYYITHFMYIYRTQPNMAQNLQLVSRNEHAYWPNNIRCAVTTAHGLCGQSFAEIGRASGGLIPPRAANKIWHHTVEAAQIALQTDSIPTWDQLLEYVEPSKKSGRPKVLDKPSKTQLRQAYLDNAFEPFDEVAEQQGLKISRIPARKIAKGPSPEHPYKIVKRKMPTKLPLNDNDRRRRRSSNVLAGST